MALIGLPSLATCPCATVLPLRRQVYRSCRRHLHGQRHRVLLPSSRHSLHGQQKYRRVLPLSFQRNSLPRLICARSPTRQSADARMLVNRTIEVQSVQPRTAKNAKGGMPTGYCSMTKQSWRLWMKITAVIPLVMMLHGRAATLQTSAKMAYGNSRIVLFQHAILARACPDAASATNYNAVAPVSFRPRNAAIVSKNKKSIVHAGASI